MRETACPNGATVTRAESALGAPDHRAAGYTPGSEPASWPMTVSPVSVQICAICAPGSCRCPVRRCRDDGRQCAHASAEGWRPDRHLRELPVIACGSWQYGTFGPAVDGWVAMVCKRRQGPLEDAGMWASSPHTTQSGSARSRMGPLLRMPVEIALQPAATRAISGWQVVSGESLPLRRHRRWPAGARPCLSGRGPWRPRPGRGPVAGSQPDARSATLASEHRERWR